MGGKETRAPPMAREPATTGQAPRPCGLWTKMDWRDEWRHAVAANSPGARHPLLRSRFPVRNGYIWSARELATAAALRSRLGRDACCSPPLFCVFRAANFLCIEQHPTTWPRQSGLRCPDAQQATGGGNGPRSAARALAVSPKTSAVARNDPIGHGERGTLMSLIMRRLTHVYLVTRQFMSRRVL